MGKQKAGKGLARPPHAKGSSQPASTSLGYGLVIIAVLVAAAAMSLPYLQTPVPPPVVTPPKSRSSRGTQQADAVADCSVQDDEMCVAWHKAGYCHRRSKLVTGMPRRCPRTCGLCPGVEGRNPPVAREDRCSRDNQSAAVPAGALHGLFEHILASFPEYNPTALSTSPYVIRLDNFISEEEAAAFQRVCRPKFERSLAGDQLNPVRTSFQCWCNFAECFTDPLVHRVTARINNLTGTPYDNGEDLQIVRYEPGQFYRRHHDQNTAVWAPQGPRVLTFFMYLNEVEDGGETAFPAIRTADGHLVVKPKLGSAILWPSTLDAQPMEADMRTDHEAMPVHTGIKYGANMWIHQFSFKSPSERGCELTYVNTVGRRPASQEHQALVEGRVPTYEETVRLAASQSPQP